MLAYKDKKMAKLTTQITSVLAHGVCKVWAYGRSFSTNKNIRTLEFDLPCRPCSKDGRGKCERDIYQECMVNISVEKVKVQAINILRS